MESVDAALERIAAHERAERFLALELQHARHEIRLLTARLAAQTAERDAAVVLAAEERAGADHRIGVAQALVQDRFLRSHSWRITRPLRAVTAVLGRRRS